MVCVLAASSAVAADVDWPSYNRTVSGDRYSALGEINRSDVKTLKVTCRFDTGIQTSFQSGIIEVADVLYGTTECTRVIRVRVPSRSIAALLIWMGAYFAAPRMAACSPMKPRPASVCGQR